MLPMLLDATYDTLRIVIISTIFSLILGSLLGLLLEASKNQYILGHKYLWVHNLLLGIIKFSINIPSFLLLLLLIPKFNQLFIENFTIELATVISLSIIGSIFFAKEVFNSLNTLPLELSDTARSLGASPWQLLTKFLLPEAIKPLILSITNLINNLFSLTIMASVLGVDGLGKLAIEQGYQDGKLIYLFGVILLATGIIYFVKLLGEISIRSLPITPTI